MKKLLLSIGIYAGLLALLLAGQFAWQRHRQLCTGTFGLANPGFLLDIPPEQPWQALLDTLPDADPPSELDSSLRDQALYTLEAQGIRIIGKEPLRRAVPNIPELFELDAPFSSQMALIELLLAAPSPELPEAETWNFYINHATLDWTLRVGGRLYGVQETLLATAGLESDLYIETTHTFLLGTNAYYSPTPLPVVRRVLATGITIHRPGPIWPLLFLLGMLPVPLAIALKRPIGRMLRLRR